MRSKMLVLASLVFAAAATVPAFAIPTIPGPTDGRGRAIPTIPGPTDGRGRAIPTIPGPTDGRGR